MWIKIILKYVCDSIFSIKSAFFHHHTKKIKKSEHTFCGDFMVFYYPTMLLQYEITTWYELQITLEFR